MRRHPGRLPTAARLWPGLSAAAAPLLRPPAPGLVARSSELGPGAALSAGPRLRARREGDPPSRRGTAAPSPLAHAARRGAPCLCSREFCSEKSPRVWAKNRAESPAGSPGRTAETPSPPGPALAAGLGSSGLTHGLHIVLPGRGWVSTALQSYSASHRYRWTYFGKLITHPRFSKVTV